ncbi:MAG: recombinase family protein [Puniceicoccales bacterium]
MPSSKRAPSPNTAVPDLSVTNLLRLPKHELFQETRQSKEGARTGSHLRSCLCTPFRGKAREQEWHSNVADHFRREGCPVSSHSETTEDYHDDWIDGGIYLRLSDERQVRGEVHSLDSQEIRVRDLFKKLKINAVKVYIDRGWSGRKSKRPDWKSMSVDIKTGVIQAIGAYKMERCARDSLEGIIFIDTCIKHRCHIHSCSEDLQRMGVRVR